MNILLIIGNHARHLFLANQIISSFNNTFTIIEKRNPIGLRLKNKYSKRDKNNFLVHFTEREKVENKVLSSNSLISKKNSVKINSIQKEEKKVLEILNHNKPKIVITFGCGIIRDPLLSKLPKYSFNFHTGLLPYYRGTAGNFWPFYGIV